MLFAAMSAPLSVFAVEDEVFEAAANFALEECQGGSLAGKHPDEFDEVLDYALGIRGKEVLAICQTFFRGQASDAEQRAIAATVSGNYQAAANLYRQAAGETLDGAQVLRFFAGTTDLNEGHKRLSAEAQKYQIMADIKACLGQYSDFFEVTQALWFAFKKLQVNDLKGAIRELLVFSPAPGIFFDAYRIAAQISLLEGDFESLRMAAFYFKECNCWEESGRLYLQVGQTYLQNNDYKKAINVLRDAITCFEQPGLQGEVGELYRQAYELSQQAEQAGNA